MMRGGDPVQLGESVGGLLETDGIMINRMVLLPARASEQGNVIGSVSVYIYIYIYVIKKKL